MIQQFHFEVHTLKIKVGTQIDHVYTDVHISIIHNSLNIKTTKYPLTDEWVNKIWYENTM